MTQRDELLNHLGSIKWPSFHDTQNVPVLPERFKHWHWSTHDVGVCLLHNFGPAIILEKDVKEFWAEKQQPGVINQRITAPEFLDAGAKHMRDSETGERSMKACVDAFNALYGTQLNETQGWQFMVLLKMSRARTGVFCRDDYEDQAAYAALAGESAQ